MQIARVHGGEGAVPLEVHTDASTDAPRYRIVGFHPLRAQRVARKAPGDYYPDHRADCPSYGNGL